ncbi:MAG: hypothetical protein AAFO29_14075, partial [Actinomycetota bacterium]
LDAGHLTVHGTAEHPRGVAVVELVLKQLETDRYWNGSGWQSEFIRFPVAVADDAAVTTAWAHTVDLSGWDRGNYRARAFARSNDGNGDANGGDLVEFQWRPQLDRGLYDTEITEPAAGAMVAGSISIGGVARSSDGVAKVVVMVRNLDSGDYWNGSAWTSAFTRIEAIIEPTNGYSTEVEWSASLPDSLAPGRYRTRAWVRTETGLNDPFGRGQIAFEVVDSPTTTTTTPDGSTTTSPSTTVRPTTVPPTTVRPTTTRPTTVPPTTTRPTTTRPSTTQTTVGTTTTTPADDCPDGDPELLIPCSGVLLGATGDFTNDDGSPISNREHFRSREAQLGADFDIFHDFVQWNELVLRTWPKADVAELAADGRILFTNWKSPTSHPRDWAAIARGDYDDDIVAAAQKFAAFGEPTFLTFYHEPEDNIRDAGGDNAALVQRYIDDYRDAFRHLHDVFEAEGADNVIWVWDMQGWLGGWESYYTGGLYPGDDVVDWVAWNPYNWYGCVNHGSSTRWRSFTEVVAPFYDWLEVGGPDRPGLDKPLMLGEFGSEENTGATNSGQTKAEWLAEAQRVLPERFPRLQALVYFDTEGRRANGTVQFCRWGLDSSQSSLDAMTRLLLDDDLRARW